MIAKLFLSIGLLASGAGLAGAQTLEQLLPRGSQTCYGAASSTHPVFAMVRVTRPQRFQPYDDAGVRMVRVVLNFRKPEARLEDTANCRLKSGELVCISTSCDGAEFRLQASNPPFRIVFEGAAPKAFWSCAEQPLRSLVVAARQRMFEVERGAGTCIAD